MGKLKFNEPFIKKYNENSNMGYITGHNTGSRY